MRLYVDSKFASPYALSAFVALRAKRVDFQLVSVDLDAGEHRGLPYAAASMTSRVPALVDGGFTLSESSAIAEYLEDTVHGPRLYPTDYKQHARARQLQAWLRSDLTALRQDRSSAVIFFRPSTAPLSPSARLDVRRLLRAADSLPPTGCSHLFGEWSIADVDLALMLNRLVFNDDTVPPRLRDYAEHQWQHPAIQEWMAKPRTSHGED
jgi:glutathione S-transferase